VQIQGIADVVWVATRGVKSRGHLRLSDGTDKEIAARSINSDLTPAVEPLNCSSRLTSSCAQVSNKAESEEMNWKPGSLSSCWAWAAQVQVVGRQRMACRRTT